MADVNELGYGFVKARFVQGLLDSNDAGDNPDVLPLTGYVEFTATAPAIRVVSASPAPVTVFPQKLRVYLNDNGYLEHMGSTLVALWATDDTDGNPVNWQWKVSFFLQNLDSKDITYPSFNFALPAGTTVDLTEVAPLQTPSPGTIIIKGAKGDAGGPVELGKVGDPAFISWRPITDPASSWTPIIAISELIGPEGESTGVPNGGTAGQTLIKQSSADQDAIWAAMTKTLVGLGLVDNTADADKPISTAQAAVNSAQTTKNASIDAAIALRAPLADAALTGSPTAPTQSVSDVSTKLATTAHVTAKINALVSGAPGLLDTLDEIAAALGDDPNFATTMLTALASKMDSSKLGAPLGAATLDSGGLVPEAQTRQATTTVKGVAEIATNTEVATATDTDRIVTPAGLQSRVATSFGPTVVAGKLIEISAWATALGVWPFPIIYNTTSGSWPARSSVIPSWWTGAAKFEAKTTVNVAAPADLVTGDTVVDKYAA